MIKREGKIQARQCEQWDESESQIAVPETHAAFSTAAAAK